MKDLRGMLRLVCLILLASFSAAAPARADVITQWNEQVLALGGASRTLAMVQVAMFDAINAIQPRYQPYLQLPAAPVGALPEAAAASAAYGVLVRLLPGQVAQLNATLASSLASLPDGAGKTSGVQYRRHRRGRDVSKHDSPTTSSCRGRSTFRQVYLARIKSPPLAHRSRSTRTHRTGFHSHSTSASQFRPSAPPALTSKRYADDLNETRGLGELTSPYRSAIDDETAVWHTELAQFQLNRIARAEVATDGRDLLAHARLFALLNLALADAATSVFDARTLPFLAACHRDSQCRSRRQCPHRRRSWMVSISDDPSTPGYPAAHGVIQTAGTRVLEKLLWTALRL